MSLVFCSLFSGSSGNAHYIQSDNTRLLLDAGLSGAMIEKGLSGVGADAKALDGILITHEHIDHIRGAFILSRRYDLPVYANAATHAAMTASAGRVNPANVRVFETGVDFYIGDLCVSPFAIPHDAAEPVGFCVENGRKKIAIATDLGHANDKLLSRVADADILLLEANHDETMLKNGPYPASLKKRILGNKGHLSNRAAGEALIRLAAKGMRTVLLGHLSEQNNTPERALATVTETLECAGIRAGADMAVEMAWRDRASGYYVIQ